ncbi:hypothetical protein [Acidovorax sp. SUPP2825]|uniref:hypothetical protein n=1 Tax=Acidovorax sp. SUPP2825 TaxID=2920879 RepID=UPI0023DE4B3F|nr:hypothetical protein [Acidovorax sp. SUPP2825]GKS96468.1 hypothetical protein AVAK2825_18055 [Acidovorax sp. SUPP2825]
MVRFLSVYSMKFTLGPVAEIASISLGFSAAVKKVSRAAMGRRLKGLAVHHR